MHNMKTTHYIQAAKQTCEEALIGALIHWNHNEVPGREHACPLNN